YIITLLYNFFFASRRRHTISKRDWSSDVCSSDLPPVFYETMKAKGVYSEATVSDVINNVGSVQHVDWLTPDEKQVFLNAYEVDQRAILRHASLRQPYTCQGQSLNFFVADEGSEDLIADLMTA